MAIKDIGKKGILKKKIHIKRNTDTKGSGGA